MEYIEEELRGTVDIDVISERTHISPFYLQKGFQIMTGYSMGEYIRARRLYEAGLELCREDARVLDTALRYGYESPESFTKAFSRFHGVTPAQLKRESARLHRFLPFQIQIRVMGGDQMNYTVSPMFGFKVIGFERVFSAETAYAEIPEFWDEICERHCKRIYAWLPAETPEEKAIMDNCIGEYGVCIDDIGPGKFRYMIAGRYTGGEVPEGMTLYEFPAGEWAKFKCVGPMPEALQTLNTAIFREWLPGNTEFELAGNCNIEWYSCDGEKTDPDYESGIWLPVRRK